MAQAAHRIGARNLSGDAAQQLAAHGRQAHPFGEALAIHFAAQHAQLDQPDQVALCRMGVQGGSAVGGAGTGDGAAAQGRAGQRLVERTPERQAAQRLTGAPQGPRVDAWQGGTLHGCFQAVAASKHSQGRPLHAGRQDGPFPVISAELPLLLASASPARRRLLEQARIAHRVQVSGVDEAAITHADPAQLVLALAAAKAAAVHAPLAAAGELARLSGVLGCDSVLAFDGEVFGKPADAADAIARWQQMAGGWGELHTGHCLIAAGCGAGLSDQRATITTRVHFAPLTEAQIEAYVATGEPLSCAGAFALEGIGGLVVERIEGCFSNVIGLSLPLLRRWLS